MQRRLLIGSLILLPLLLGSASRLRAASEEILPPVIVEARPTTGAVTVIDEQDIAERRVWDLPEALDVMPGVMLRPGNRGGVRIDIHGAKQRSLLVMLDGVPLTDFYYGAFPLELIPADMIARITVSSTPGSILSGPFGAGGVVSVETREPTSTPTAAVRVGTGARYGIVGDGRHWRGSARHGWRPGAVGYQVGADLLKRQAIPLPQGTRGLGVVDGERENSDLEQLLAYGGATYHGPENLRMSVNLLGAFSEYGVPAEQSASQFLRRVPTQQSLLGRARVESGRVGHLRFDGSLYTGVYRFEGDLIHRGRAQTVLSDEVLAYGAGGRAAISFPIKRTLLHTSIYAHHEAANILSKATGARISYERDRQLAGAALAWRVPLGDDLGLVPSVGANVDVHDGALGDLSPEASLVATWQVSSQLYVESTSAYRSRPATLRELGDPWKGNPDLQGERVWAQDLRGFYSPWGRLRLGAGAFVKWRQDAIVSVRQGDGDERYENLGGHRVEGLEASAETRRWHGLRATVTGTWMRSSEPIPNFPALSGVGNLDYESPFGLGVSALVRAVSDRENDGAEAPSWHRVDAVLRYALGPAEVSLRGVNLLDADIELAPFQPGAGRALFLDVGGHFE